MPKKQPETTKRSRPGSSSRPTSGQEDSKALVDPTEAFQGFPDEEEVERIIQEAERALKKRPEDISTSFAQYLYELQRYPLLTPEQEYRLAVEARKGSRAALDALIRHNLRFVIAIARKHATNGVQLEDLVQEGNIGLMRAVRKFNPDIGVKFVSYAIWWIQQAIQVGLARDQRSIRLPINRATQLGQIRRASAQIKEELGRGPTTTEIASRTGIPEHIVKNLLLVGQADISLDAPMPNDHENAGGALAERIRAAIDLDQMLERQARSRYIAEALSHLRPRDAEILRLHFGLDGGREYTLEEIGTIMGVTRERIRQVRDRALRELRTRYGKALEDYAGIRLSDDAGGES